MHSSSMVLAETGRRTAPRLSGGLHPSIPRVSPASPACFVR